MRLTRTGCDRPTASLDLLVVRARRGDRRAAAALRRRTGPQVHQLAAALAVDPRSVPALVRHALTDALADDDRDYGPAVVAAVQRRAGAVRVRPAASRPSAAPLQQAVAVLCDAQGHSHASAAALLGQPVDRVATLHRAARTALGVDGPQVRCHGWHLVSRRADLTPPEQEAAAGHLELCRVCRDEVAARALARRRVQAGLPLGGTAAGGLAVLLANLGGGSLVAGTTAIGAAAVLGVGALVAVVPPAGMTAQDPTSFAPATASVPAGPVPTVEPAPPPDAAPVPAVDPAPPAGPTPTRSGAAPTPAGAPSPAPGASPPPAIPLPTSPPIPLPTELPGPTSPPIPPPTELPGPTSIPLPLPSAVPVPVLSLPDRTD